MTTRAPFSCAAIVATVLIAACQRGDQEASRDEPVPTRIDEVSWQVTADGLGPIRIGMTTAEARAAVGDAWNETAGPPISEDCTHARIADSAATMRAMTVGGRVARVEVDSGAVATDRGARVGDSEARIDSLYRGLVRVQPHKYSDGHYLVVVAPSDTTRRIVFETDGRVVTRYRAGKMPEVEWVEGCA
jgi:hypothetical protein